VSHRLGRIALPEPVTYKEVVKPKGKCWCLSLQVFFKFYILVFIIYLIIYAMYGVLYDYTYMYISYFFTDKFTLDLPVQT
jgi:hypothetical protein